MLPRHLHRDALLQGLDDAHDFAGRERWLNERGCHRLWGFIRRILLRQLRFKLRDPGVEGDDLGARLNFSARAFHDFLTKRLLVGVWCGLRVGGNGQEKGGEDEKADHAVILYWQAGT